MGIGMLQEIDDGTIEFYDAVAAILAIDDDPPDGLIVHAAAVKEGGGIRIMDVWESREAFDRFTDERVRPAVAKVAAEAGQPVDGPQPRVFELHHLVRG